MRKFIFIPLALVCMGIGLITLPLPLPTGLVLLAFGFGLLLSVSRTAKYLFGRFRKRNPKMNEKLRSIKCHLPKWLRMALFYRDK